MEGMVDEGLAPPTKLSVLNYGAVGYGFDGQPTSIPSSSINLSLSLSEDKNNLKRLLVFSH